MRNKKVILLSAIGIVSLPLVFLIHWAFIIIPIVAVILNQRELIKNRK